jgi:hypothetical protein
MMKCFSDLRKEMRQGFAEVNYRVDLANHRIDESNKAIESLEHTVDKLALNHATRIEILEDDAGAVKKLYKTKMA